MTSSEFVICSLLYLRIEVAGTDSNDHVEVLAYKEALWNEGTRWSVDWTPAEKMSPMPNVWIVNEAVIPKMRRVIHI